MSGAYFMRWKRGESRLSREFPPLTQDHPAFDKCCVACGWLLGNDMPVQLYALGPYDEESEAKHDAGGWYSAPAELLHADCAVTVAAKTAREDA